VYLICTKFGVKLDDVEKCIVNKTNFALKLYGKYRTNLKGKIGLMQSGKLFEWGEERALLLAEIDGKGFYSFLGELQEFLKKIVSSLNYKL